MRFAVLMDGPKLVTHVIAANEEDAWHTCAAVVSRFIRMPTRLSLVKIDEKGECCLQDQVFGVFYPYGSFERV